MLDAYYRIATPLLMGSYSIMNDAKISVKPTWQTSKRIGEEREKRGGLGRDERFSPSPSPEPFFCVTATQAMGPMDARPLNKRKQRTRNGWTGKHRRCFNIIPYHVCPQG